MMIKNTLLGILSVVLCVNPLNYVSAATTCSNSIRYFYINGVSVVADKNRGSVADSIQELLVSRGITTTEVVAPLRNPSEGIFIDVFVELANQKLLEKSSASFARAIRDATAMWTGDRLQSQIIKYRLPATG